MRQLDAELRRFFARRIVRITFLVAILIIVLAVTIGTAKGHAGYEYSIDTVTGHVTDTRTGRVVANQPPGEYTSDFSGSDGRGNIVYGQSDTRTNIGKDLANVLEGTGVALLFAAFALGASFVGAEFNVGSLTTQLLFQSRRWRVHIGKAAAVALGTALVAFAVMLFVALAMYVGSELNGVVHGVDGAFLVDRTLQALRIAAVCGTGAMLAYSVTLVAKRSSAGMIAFFLQFVLLNLIDPTKKPFGPISHYMPLRGLLAVVLKHTAHRRKRAGACDPHHGRRCGPDGGLDRRPGRRRRGALRSIRGALKPAPSRYRRHRWPNPSTSSWWAPGPRAPRPRSRPSLTACTSSASTRRSSPRQDLRRRAHGERPPAAGEVGGLGRRPARRRSRPSCARPCSSPRAVAGSGCRSRPRARTPRSCAAGCSMPRSSTCARRRGVEIREGCAIEDVKQVGGEGASSRSPTAPCSTASFVIAADGHWSTVRRAAGTRRAA